MGRVVLAVALSLLTDCAAKKQPTIFVLRQCQTVEEVDIIDFHNKRDHTELTCLCNRRTEKIDGKTGKLIIECE